MEFDVGRVVDNTVNSEIKKFGDEVCRFRERVNKFENFVVDNSSFGDNKVSPFMTKIIPLALKNLSKNHEDIHQEKNPNGRNWGSITYVSTNKGLRKREQYHSIQTSDLGVSDILFIFKENRKIFEDWIKVKSPKKLTNFQEIANLFISLDKDWVEKEDVSNTLVRTYKIQSETFTFVTADADKTRTFDMIVIATRGRDSKIFLTTNESFDRLKYPKITEERDEVYFIVGGSGYGENISDNMEMFSIRRLLPTVSRMIDRYTDEVKDMNIKRNKWIDNLKNQLNRYYILSEM